MKTKYKMNKLIIYLSTNKKYKYTNSQNFYSKFNENEKLHNKNKKFLLLKKLESKTKQ